MDIILPFPLNHSSLLLIYSTVFYVPQLNLVWRFNGMRVFVRFLSWQYLATSVAVATLFHVSWALISFLGFFAFQTPAWIGAD